MITRIKYYIFVIRWIWRHRTEKDCRQKRTADKNGLQTKMETDGKGMGGDEKDEEIIKTGRC
jgi:hypothetical protein